VIKTCISIRVRYLLINVQNTNLSAKKHIKFQVRYAFDNVKRNVEEDEDKTTTVAACVNATRSSIRRVFHGTSRFMPAT